MKDTKPRNGEEPWFSQSCSLTVCLESYVVEALRVVHEAGLVHLHLVQDVLLDQLRHLPVDVGSSSHLSNMHKSRSNFRHYG